MTAAPFNLHPVTAEHDGLSDFTVPGKGRRRRLTITGRTKATCTCNDPWPPTLVCPRHQPEEYAAVGRRRSDAEVAS